MNSIILFGDNVMLSESCECRFVSEININKTDMKNYFQSENIFIAGREASRWANDVTETINQAYKKQMEMSAQFYNRIFDIPVSKDSATWGENFWGLKVWTDYMNMAKRNLDIYTDWAKKTSGVAVNSIDEPVFLSEELLEKYIEKYEHQIREIKDFNNLFIDTLANSPNKSVPGQSRIISNFKKSTEDNLDLFMNTVKAVLKPGSENVLADINKQLHAITKLNYEIWADMVALITDNTSDKNNEAQKDHDEKAVEELVKTAKQHQAKPEYHEFKSKKYNSRVNRVKPRVRVTHKK